MKQASFFEGGRRLQMNESIELTIQSLQAYLPDHPDVGMAWSGGKDSTAMLTVFVWLMESGRIPKPRSLTIFLADTRMELLPLWAAAMQIIEELEPVRRGPYTGSLGYFSRTGTIDLNILIRTMALTERSAYLQVGAGIVADSDPGREYQETLDKAQAFFSALHKV